ncbi:MAG TPA: hypothetical protein VGR47_15370 [Terracidiphilus sp.]|nr:hypothetical protein [Terracidiphilus sp.]
MKTQNKIGRGLAGAGCVILFAGALLHLIAGYPLVSAGVLKSNLDAGLKPALRSVFLIVGWHWIVIAVIAAVAAFIRPRGGRVVVLICGFAILVDGALMAVFLGWFVGTNMILLSALLILCGGFVLAPAKRPTEEVAN